MKAIFISFFITMIFLLGDLCSQTLFPANGTENVNPDAHFVLTFETKPQLTGKGFVKIFDAKTKQLVDVLDMSIPAGPTVADMARKKNAEYTTQPYVYISSDKTNKNTVAGTPSGLAIKDTFLYQLNIIGHFTDAFRFYPIIIHGNTATIYFHNNMLEYNKTYFITIDENVFESFRGVNAGEWTFTTKTSVPATHKLVVNNDGSGDFNTVQGAMDFIPDFSKEKWEVFIKNGDYEELVYFRNKSNVSIIGESRDGVVIHYANNETFNPHPLNIKTNELNGTFPSRRAAFAADNCTDMRFENLTLKTDLKGQAEGLLIMGKRNYLKNVHIIGSGDALQTNGSIYLEDCVIDGDGDSMLGRGPAFFKHCTISSSGPFMWIRNGKENHGNVFVECVFLGRDSVNGTLLARSPKNHGSEYSYAEAVLISCRLHNVAPIAWDPIAGDGKNTNFAEYNSRSLNGSPIDISKRHKYTKQISAQDAAQYSNPEFVLGWNPIQ
ncbi:hypothetical protein FACS1894153_1910 [Bacteroidia bacterium]|nr:hypothetical protein FACS1894153_1910 [Bacteroidia bacterium]